MHEKDIQILKSTELLFFTPNDVPVLLLSFMETNSIKRDENKETHTYDYCLYGRLNRCHKSSRRVYDTILTVAILRVIFWKGEEIIPLSNKKIFPVLTAIDLLVI